MGAHVDNDEDDDVVVVQTRPYLAEDRYFSRLLNGVEMLLCLLISAKTSLLICAPWKGTTYW